MQVRPNYVFPFPRSPLVSPSPLAHPPWSTYLLSTLDALFQLSRPIILSEHDGGYRYPARRVGDMRAKSVSSSPVRSE
jgi:hypothetical protein